MKSDDAPPGAIIVGGGFSGTMAAAQLARRGIASVLVEGGGRAGRGTAYSTSEAAHLLNVPAAKMSAWADAPDDFVAAGHAPGEFAQRRQFGAYLGAILDAAVASGAVRVESACAVAAQRTSERGGWQVTLDDGRTLGAPHLVLANGNQPPEPMRVAEGVSPERFIANPWRSGEAVARLAASGADALILGTGLTMVDMVLSLDAAGHQGRVIALSRRGQVPRAHAAYDPVETPLASVPIGNLLALWRWLRRRAAEIGWRAAVDGLRPHSHAIWRGLERDEQGRFLRHARPWWDVHRHRIAPQIAERLRALIAEGRLEVMAGRLIALDEDEAGLSAHIARRGDGQVVRQVGAAFNCTGPLGAMARTRDPLLRQMIDDRLIAIQRIGMGIEVDGDSRAGERLWALGPLAKGALWEIVAVPDIRGQVSQVAAAIAEEVDA